jgi:hypothetical protein
MPSLFPTAQQWKRSGLVPTSGLAGWHMFEEGVSGHNVIADYSGNGRTLTCSPTNAPVVSAETGPNGQYSWYFNGTNTVPLAWSGSIGIHHAFVIASHEDAAFNENRGLLGSVTSGADLLVSNSSGTTFFNFGFGTLEYRKSGVLYAENNMQAPMGGQFALLEWKLPTGAALDGIQIGRQRDIAARIWKGRFCESLVYAAPLSDLDVERVRLYANIKYAQWENGLPFYFPSDDLMQFKRSRFYAQPPNWEKVTDSFEFEDGGKTFNEVASIAPRRWEYDYLGRKPDEVIIFDEFYNQARLANPFIFRDKYGKEWTNVRVENYNRDHDAHRSWVNDTKFKLVKYP